MRKVKSQAASSSWNASEFENLHITREDGASGPLVSNAPLPGDAAMSKQIYQEAQVAAGEGARQLEADERDEHMAGEQDRLGKGGARAVKESEDGIVGRLHEVDPGQESQHRALLVSLYTTLSACT